MLHNDLPTPSRISRRGFLSRSVLTAAAAVTTSPVICGLTAAEQRNAGDLKPIDQPSLAFLKGLALVTIESARVRPGQSRGGNGLNRTGITLITPGGNYPALWTRDFAMSLDCGLIGAAEILPQLRLIAQCQNGAKERRLPSGAVIPPFAIVDHVNLAGGAVFYPGTYSAGDDQGAPPWGPLPPIDDHFYFIHIAYALWRNTGEAKFLDEVIGERPLLERLVGAFHSPAFDPKNGAAVTNKDRRAVGFGFQDSVQLIGAMSFATLLRYRAAKQLAELIRASGGTQSADVYSQLAQDIAAHLVPVFGNPAKRDGWLLAATEVGKQPDVWATLSALHLGVLPTEAGDRARKTVAAAVRAPGNAIE